MRHGEAKLSNLSIVRLLIKTDLRFRLEHKVWNSYWQT